MSSHNLITFISYILFLFLMPLADQSHHGRFCSSKVPFDFTLNIKMDFSFLVVGETAAGKASRSLAQHIPGPGGMEGMKGAASGVVGDLARARIALDERGQKLGELEERTAAMMASAESFSKHAHDVTPFLPEPPQTFSSLVSKFIF